MNPHKFQFRKTVMRNDFTKVFSNPGQRRNLTHFKNLGLQKFRKFKLQITRRAHQGWRNQAFGKLTAFKVRRLYGRHATIPQFRR